MKDEEILEMARKCEWTGTWSRDRIAFARLIQKAQREIDAGICMSLFDSDDDSCNEAETCAAAILAQED